jgi:hypothetical protein
MSKNYVEIKEKEVIDEDDENSNIDNKNIIDIDDQASNKYENTKKHYHLQIQLKI